MKMRAPWIQVAIDAKDLATAEVYVRSAVAAGADWMEAGTPLIVYEGIGAIGKLAEWSGDLPVVADFKAMDGVEKYFRSARGLGASVAVVQAAAPDASVLAAVKARKACGIEVMVDLMGLNDRAGRAKECEAMGADYLMLHLGHDEAHADAAKHVLDGLDEVVAAVSRPVGVSTFAVAEAIEAVKRGASFIIQGEPILSSPDRDKRLARFVEAVKSV
jgi:3-keto-L-gulonate-6-phosphate decarboxylase